MSQQGQTIVVYNPFDRPVQADDDGHLIGGGEYATVIKDSTTSQALAREELLEKDDPGNDLKGYSPEAKSAFHAARDANQGQQKADADDQPTARSRRQQQEG